MKCSPVNNPTAQEIGAAVPTVVICVVFVVLKYGIVLSDTVLGNYRINDECSRAKFGIEYTCLLHTVSILESAAQHLL